jgi:hypothetical protein
MPYISVGDPSSWTSNSDHYREDLGYKYPNGLNLRPDSNFHQKLRSHIWRRAQASRNEIQKRFESWKEIDRSLTVYVPVKEVEDHHKHGRKDHDKSTSIVFPYSYSMLESLLTYMSMAFFQDPMFRYQGIDTDDNVGAMLLELVIKLHCVKNKVPLNAHTVLRDCLAYGVGIGIPEWARKYGRKVEKQTIGSDSPLGITKEDRISWSGRTLLFEGNSLSNIDPYMWLPDPTVSSSNTQNGEFNGWVDRTNYLKLLADENEVDSSYFNVKYLKSRQNRRSTLALDESDRLIRHGGSNELTMDFQVTSPVDVIKMYINLIPKDWELSETDYPEKWYFELASDDVIIRCERAEHNHGMYPMAVASPEFDGYQITPIGRLEILSGLQTTLDFMFNSHVKNVRKAINDMLIVDPYLVNIDDLKDPEPGKLIRLRRPAWGRGVDKVVQQLQVNDITRLNMSDAQYITQAMDRIVGADQSMSGALRQSGPERLTGAEFQGTRGSAVSRLQRIAQIIGIQFFQDIGTMFAVHTQQYMADETFVRITGRYADSLKQIYPGKTNIRVKPSDLSVDYDLITTDGSIPGGNFSSAWIDMFKTIGTNEELASQFDVVRIFMYIAQQLGANNIEEFRRNVNSVNPVSMPDQTVQNQLKAGNLIPAGVQ